MTRLSICVWICTVVVYMFSGCGAPNIGVSDVMPSLVDTTDTLILHTEWRYITNYSKPFSDPRTGEEFIFSGDPNTHMKVRVFDSTGRSLRDIQLDSVNNMVDRINCMTLIADDSLAVLDGRGRKLLILDGSGRVVRERILVDSRCDEHGDLYELYPTTSGLTPFHGKFYLGPALLGACNGKEYYERTDSDVLNAQRYFALATAKCKLAEIDPQAMVGGVRFGACNILSHLTDVPRETIGMAYTATANDELFVVSEYSPFLHLIDAASLGVVRVIPVSYRNGPVGITPPPITEEDLHNDGSNIRAATKAYILAVTYDFPSHQYVVSVCHEVPEDTPEEDRSWRRNWSLVVLDTNFNKVAEHVLSGKEYSGSVLFGLKRGTYVMQKNLDPEGFKQPKVFHRLRL